MSWFSISEHNKKAFRLILVGLVLWPTPLPGLALLFIPGVLLLDCSLKRKVDKWVWNTKFGGYVHAKILKLFMVLESQLPFLKKKFKEQRTVYRKWKIGRWLFPRIMLMFSGTIEEFATYREMFIALKKQPDNKSNEVKPIESMKDESRTNETTYYDETLKKEDNLSDDKKKVNTQSNFSSYID